MITASTSTRLRADAMPAPSASTARSMIWCASLSSRSSAFAQTPLARRCLPFSSISLNSDVLAPPLTFSRA